MKSFLQLWAREINLDETGRAEDIQDRIVTALRGTHRLVLIDEAHKLAVATLDVIREVWDETKVPIVLAATPVLYQTITSNRAGPHTNEVMDQLQSRVGIFRNLTTLENPDTGDPEPRVSVDDIRKIFVRGGVRLVKGGTDFLCKLANTPGCGGLRVCADLVQMVVDLYPGESVSAALLNNALVMRVGVEEAGFRMETAAITQQPVAAAG